VPGHRPLFPGDLHGEQQDSADHDGARHGEHAHPAEVSEGVQVRDHAEALV
jgi:hypothetical protein